MTFLDLAAAYAELENDIEETSRRVFRRGWYVLGEEVATFETEFADYVGAKHCIGVGNGLDALELTLRAMHVGPGDEVVVPSNTFIATWLAVMNCGARPVPVEPVEASYTLCAAAIEPALTCRTRVVIPVHLYGQPADMAPIVDLARRHGVQVLADAAQAHGARYRGKPVGTLGDACTWSFYPGKNLGAMGDGGAVTTDDAALAEEIRRIRNYGFASKHECDLVGRNSRLDELQAAILRVKLRHLDAWNERRRRIAARYLAVLADTHFVLPWVPDWAEPCWHLFVVRSPQREILRQALDERGVQTQIHYPIAPYHQPACRHLGVRPADLPITERLQQEVLSLPIGPHLSDDQLDYTLQALNDVLTGIQDNSRD